MATSIYYKGKEYQVTFGTDDGGNLVIVSPSGREYVVYDTISVFKNAKGQATTPDIAIIMEMEEDEDGNKIEKGIVNYTYGSATVSDECLATYAVEYIYEYEEKLTE